MSVNALHLALYLYSQNVTLMQTQKFSLRSGTVELDNWQFLVTVFEAANYDVARNLSQSRQMNQFPCFCPKISDSCSILQFGYNFSRQIDCGAGIACFCHSLFTSLAAKWWLLGPKFTQWEWHKINNSYENIRVVKASWDRHMKVLHPVCSMRVAIFCSRVLQLFKIAVTALSHHDTHTRVWELHKTRC